METYIGCGFDTDDLTDEDWLGLVKTDPGDLAKLKNACLKRSGRDDDEMLRASVTGWLKERYGLPEYLKDTVNKGEKDAAGTDEVVNCRDNYLLFVSAEYAGDDLSPRAEYIKDQSDFVRMIGRYVPIEHITFCNIYENIWGNLYDSEWMRAEQPEKKSA